MLRVRDWLPASLPVPLLLRLRRWQPVWLRRWPAVRLRRWWIALLLVGLVIFPGRAPSGAAQACRGPNCPGNGTIRWSEPLDGAWQVVNGPDGTVPSQGQAYVGVGAAVAAVGLGLSVTAYDAVTGSRLWTTTLTGHPAGSAISSLRVWPGVVTVGVEVPAGVGGSGGSGGSGGGGQAKREEVVLDVASGQAVAAFPAAQYGGAVSASRRSAVIVGANDVTSFSNRTGHPLWRVLTGSYPQGWRVDAGSLYVTISARGVLGTAPVTAVREINLENGTQRLIRPPAGPFAGRLAGAADGMLLFADGTGLGGYSTQTGVLAWHRDGGILVGNDPVQHVLYVDSGPTLAGINPATGQTRPGMWLAGPAGTYGVRAGIALGLDTGAGGAAWGYGLAKRRVIWTSQAVPWSHYFVDLSGLGGSADASGGTGIVLLATCGKTGAQLTGAAGSGGPAMSALACLKPRLVAIDR